MYLSLILYILITSFHHFLPGPCMVLHSLLPEPSFGFLCFSVLSHCLITNISASFGQAKLTNLNSSSITSCILSILYITARQWKSQQSSSMKHREQLESFGGKQQRWASCLTTLSHLESHCHLFLDVPLLFLLLGAKL